MFVVHHIRKSHPLDRRMPELWSRSGRIGEGKIPATAGNQVPVVQPVASHYID
jgi:hypothetical protein